ncbi:THAP domain-containing protein 2-like isoform X2 [Melanaphis sacchari]|uniref:THAP domain-containing protein 2-like isoform X2 n=1 Tax=Melanaphis sacchari TaxID=742174 RepID=UPI000DC1356F|nr:THAP domain-containing protein 2-like isoform X2 [Melanaphis sacchari]
MARKSSTKFCYPQNFCIACNLPKQKLQTSLHSFPSCPKKRQDWIHECRLPEEIVLPNSKLCANHFAPTCFKPDIKRRILHRDAVPTIFKHLTTKIPTRKPEIVITKKPTKRSNTCIVCKSTRKHLRSNYSLHAFPICLKERQVWLNQCKLTKEVLPSHKICSYHFEPTCFKPGLKKRTLYPDAIPTIFDEDSDCKVCLKKAVVVLTRIQRPRPLDFKNAKTTEETMHLWMLHQAFLKYHIKIFEEKIRSSK